MEFDITKCTNKWDTYTFIKHNKEEPEVNDLIDDIYDEITLPVNTFEMHLGTTAIYNHQFAALLFEIVKLNYHLSQVLIMENGDRILKVPIIKISKNIKECGKAADEEIVDFIKASEVAFTNLNNYINNDGCDCSVYTDEADSDFESGLLIKICPKAPESSYALESVDLKGKTALKQAIDSTLSIFKMLDESEYLRVKDMINSFNKEEDLIQFLINPINVYFEPMKEPNGLTLNAIKKKERIIVSEHVYLPFKGRVEVDGVLYPVRSAKRLTIYHTYVRKNQQIANKEAKSADTINSADILGMSAGAGKVGTFSDAEWTTCLQQNNNNIIKELCGPGSADMGQKKEMRAQLMNHGEVDLEDLPDDTENKRVLKYLDHILKSMGLDSDLIQYPE